MGKPFKKAEYKPEDWITRDEAISLLGIKPTTFKVYLSQGKIPDKFISKGINGIKFFNRPGLIGFDN